MSFFRYSSVLPLDELLLVPIVVSLYVSENTVDIVDVSADLFVSLPECCPCCAGSSGDVPFVPTGSHVILTRLYLLHCAMSSGKVDGCTHWSGSSSFWSEGSAIGMLFSVIVQYCAGNGIFVLWLWGR